MTTASHATAEMTPLSQTHDAGLPESARTAVVEGLRSVLADTYTLYLMTHKFHWNVTGMNFAPLHDLFEIHYRDLAEAVDTLAERIRALGGWSPGSYEEFQALTVITPAKGRQDAASMLRSLVEAHEAVCRSIRPVLVKADTLNDDATSDLLVTRLRYHEKTTWMLRAHLG